MKKLLFEIENIESDVLQKIYSTFNLNNLEDILNRHNYLEILERVHINLYKNKKIR